LLESYPGPIRCIAIQFPDPHFKRKHHKRRVVNEEFIKMCHTILDGKNESYLFIQSDVEESAAQMRDRIDSSNLFNRIGQYTKRNDLLIREKVCSMDCEEYWTFDGKRNIQPSNNNQMDYGDFLIGNNPLGSIIVTEREVQNIALNEPIYRCLFQKK